MSSTYRKPWGHGNHGVRPLLYLTARGDLREDIFLDDDDRVRFLDLLGREVSQQGWLCYAYCLMDNHYHLLVETPEANLVQGMRRLNGVYTQAFNRRHNRVGHVFQGRYKSILVDRDGYLLELCRYVVLNPVRAGMTARAEDYRWSSSQATRGQCAAPDWLAVDAVLGLFAGRSPRSAYERFVAQGIDQRSVWKDLRGQIYLGRDRFLAAMQAMADRKPAHGTTQEQRRPARPDRHAVIVSVARTYGVQAHEVVSRTHAPAYRAAAYLLRRAANLPLAQVASQFGVSAARISQIQHEVEDGHVDATLQGLLQSYKIKL